MQKAEQAEQQNSIKQSEDYMSIWFGKFLFLLTVCLKTACAGIQKSDGQSLHGRLDICEHTSRKLGFVQLFDSQDENNVSINHVDLTLDCVTLQLRQSQDTDVKTTTANVDVLEPFRSLKTMINIVRCNDFIEKILPSNVRRKETSNMTGPKVVGFRTSFTWSTTILIAAMCMVTLRLLSFLKF